MVPEAIVKPSAQQTPGNDNIQQHRPVRCRADDRRLLAEVGEQPPLEQLRRSRKSKCASAHVNSSKQSNNDPSGNPA
ncbi:hypothetical protein D3C75_924390 [compost metagenome]